MDRDSSGSQPRRYFRFSLGMMLIFITCVCCFLAGNMRGHRSATAAMWERVPTYTATYYADDLAAQSNGDGAVVDYAPLIATIKQRCSPEFWDGAGGPGKMTTSPANDSLRIDADSVVHQQVANLVAELRREKFGSDYHFVPQGAPPPALATYTRTYYVDDLLIEGESETGQVYVDFNGLMTKIVETCSPDFWEAAGGPGRISPFPLNYSLIIHADELAHKQISEFLTQLRTERFGPDYQVKSGAVAEALAARAEQKKMKPQND